MKRFVLFTTGRAGSTALMDKLESYEDVAVPNKQMPCRDNEILNPEFVESYIQFYRSHGFRITSEMSLVNAFFELASRSPYAGFKSMPNRHRNLQVFVQSEDIQFITLEREDLASTVASFIVAIDRDTWRRDGGEQVHGFEFKGEYVDRARSHLDYILSSSALLGRIPGAIKLTYEEICRDDFDNAQLNGFFGRVIKLDRPQAPTNAEHYVRNWDSFKRYIDDQAQLIRDRLNQNEPGTA